jgi:hypothetical protein
MLFRPLPYADPDRLVQIHQMKLGDATPFAALPRNITVALAAASTSFSGIAYAAHTDSTLPGPDGSPLRIGYGVALTLVAGAILGARCPRAAPRRAHRSGYCPASLVRCIG